MNAFALRLLCALLPGLCGMALAAEEELPAAWKPWADRLYTHRYLLEVHAPPDQGATGLQPEATVATVVLPLKALPILNMGEPAQDSDAQTSRPEDILLLDEAGHTLPVLLRQMKGGNEIQIAFPCGKGQRRFCLYAGAPTGSEAKTSPVTFAPKALRVRVHCAEWSNDRLPAPKNPLTLERMRGISLEEGRLLQDLRTNMDDPEPPVPPYAEDPERRLPRLRNPENYVAVYEGFLRTPLAGSYEFACQTYGAAFLTVNGTKVLGAGEPDAKRTAFALTGKMDLPAGVQRVVLYHAQAGMRPGLRLLWKPPGEADYATVPSQSFVRGLPAVVTGLNIRKDEQVLEQSFVHVEVLGQVKTGLHQGPAAAREWVRIYARAAGPLAGEGRLVRLTAPGCAPLDLPSAGGQVWLPAGGELTAELINRGGGALPQPIIRKFTCPTETAGARDVDLFQGELVLKSAPQFLYPDEIGQLHLEAQLNPLPLITTKERLLRGLLRPEPQPHGSFRLLVRVTGAKELDASMASRELTGAADFDANPAEAGRQKLRVPVDGARLEALARSGAARLELELCVGGVPAERFVFRLLHARQPWTGKLAARAGQLEYVPAADRPSEWALFVVPREDEADYRRFQPLGLRGLLGTGAKTALLVGDPLSEAPVGTKPDAAIGLAGKLPQACPELTWTTWSMPGPHQGRFVYKLIEGVEACLQNLPEGKTPDLAVVTLGGADAAGQTPLHDFERGLDLVVDRLRMRGIKRIVLMGVVPEPGRPAQGELYQQRLTDVLRQHHLDAVDPFALWTRLPDGSASKDWMKRFALDPEGKSPVYGPMPNGDALDELIEALKAKLR